EAVRELERRVEGRKIVGMSVNVVPRGGLAGAARAPPVMRNYAEAVLREEKHLAVPSVGAQRPAVRECYDRAFAPIFVVELGAVLGSDEVCHVKFSFVVLRECRSCRLCRAATLAIGGAIPFYEPAPSIFLGSSPTRNATSPC